jgi:hypothetical protein
MPVSPRVAKMAAKYNNARLQANRQHQSCQADGFEHSTLLGGHRACQRNLRPRRYEPVPEGCFVGLV